METAKAACARTALKDRSAITDRQERPLATGLESDVSPKINAAHSQVQGLISRAARTSDSSLVKLKSVGAAPVINRAPWLNVRSWIAH